MIKEKLNPLIIQAKITSLKSYLKTVYKLKKHLIT